MLCPGKQALEGRRANDCMGARCYVLFKLLAVCLSLVTGRGLMGREEIKIRGDWDVTGLSPIHSRPYHPVVFAFVGINAHGTLREENDYK